MSSKGKKAFCPLLLLVSTPLLGQSPLPAASQPRIVDGRAGASLASAYKDACQSGGPVLVTPEYSGTEPLPADTCDHHVGVIDLRQADSLTGRINVRSFGAAGDGKTDDTAAIRAAIAYSLAHLSGKNAPAIYFPAGNFVVKGELRVTGQTTIVGDSAASSTIKQIDPTSNLFTVTRSRSCATQQCLGGINNIGLAGNGHLTTGTLVEVDDNEDYRVEHVVLFNHGGRGLQINGSSERFDSHDLSVTLVRWPIIIGKDSNESYFYNTKVLFPGQSADGWCYNVNCVNGRYPTYGPVAPDPHAAISVYMASDVGFYGGSIKSLQMIGGFKAFNTEVTTLDHFYLEFGYVNPGVVAGGVSDWTTTTAPLGASALSVPVKSVEWMQQYFGSASDVPPIKSLTYYAIIPPDFAWKSSEPSSIGGGITKGTYEIVGVAGFSGDGVFHIGKDSRGMKETTARDWPAGAILEAYNTGVFGLRVSNSHINEQVEFRAMGPPGMKLTSDCDNTGVKTCAEIIAGYVPDGRWVQPHGSPGDIYTAGAVSLYLDNDRMFNGGANEGVITAHGRGYLSISGGGGPSDGETAEVPYALSLAKVTGGKTIELPTYSNGHRPQFTVFDGNNGRIMASDNGFFTQLASYPDAGGQFVNGRQYANSFSIFDIPPTGKHPLNSFTFLGGPNQKGSQGLRYDHWTGASWASLFSINANINNTADVTVNGIMTAKGLKIGDGPVITSLSGKGAVAGSSAAAPSTSTLAGTTGNIGGAPLAAGKCATGTATVGGASPSMAATTSPASSPGDGFVWQAFVSQANTVSVKVCALAAGTPAPIPYDVRVFP
jgi:hypothetical protein